MSILQMSISAGVLIIIVVILRALAINKLPKKTFLVLWGIVLCRLIIPFSIPSQFSVYNIFNYAKLPLQSEIQVTNMSLSNSNAVYKYADNQIIADKVLQLDIAMIIWIIGIIAVTSFFLIMFLKNYRELRTSLPIKNHPIISKWLSKQKTIRPIQVLISDKITTPLSYGLIKPKIILPKSMDLSSESLLIHILTHELNHIKHFDTFWKIIMNIALCLHWFNPLVWVLYILMNRDLELFCDEKVIKKFGENKKSEYALSLIEMAEQKSKITPLYNGFSKNAVEERIVSIMKFKKTSIFTIVLSFLLIGGIATVFATSIDDNTTAVISTSIDNSDFTISTDTQTIITMVDADDSTYYITTDGLSESQVINNYDVKTSNNFTLSDFDNTNISYIVKDYDDNLEDQSTIIKKVVLSNREANMRTEEDNVYYSVTGYEDSNKDLYSIVKILSNNQIEKVENTQQNYAGFNIFSD